MKKIIYLLFLFFYYSSSLALNGVCYAIGRNPQSPSPYNYQEKYFVKCDCDCTNTIKKCLKCDHHHDRENQIIVDQNESPKQSKLSVQTPPTQQAAFAYLSKKIKDRKK